MKINALRPIQILNKRLGQGIEQWEVWENKMLILAYVDYLLQFIRKGKLRSNQTLSLHSKKLRANIQHTRNIREENITVIKIEAADLRLYIIIPTDNNNSITFNFYEYKYSNGSKFSVVLDKEVCNKILGKESKKNL